MVLVSVCAGLLQARLAIEASEAAFAMMPPIEPHLQSKPQLVDRGDPAPISSHAEDEESVYTHLKNCRDAQGRRDLYRDLYERIPDEALRCAALVEYPLVPGKVVERQCSRLGDNVDAGC